MKSVRAILPFKLDLISQRPPPNESTNGFPTGQANWTVRMSSPIAFRSSFGNPGANPYRLIACISLKKYHRQWTLIIQYKATVP